MKTQYDQAWIEEKFKEVFPSTPRIVWDFENNCERELNEVERQAMAWRVAVKMAIQNRDLETQRLAMTEEERENKKAHKMYREIYGHYGD